MILVRQTKGSLYFLIREGEDGRSDQNLKDLYPGRPVEVMERRHELMIVRVGPQDEAGNGGSAEHRESFAIVGLSLAAPPSRSGRSPVP